MTMTRTAAQRFVAMLGELAARQDRAALATLRRALGKPPGTVVEIFTYVVPYLPNEADERSAWPFFVVAPLYALHPVDWPANDGSRWRNFGASVALLQRRQERPSAGLQERFRRLLAAEREELPEQLRRLLTLFVPYQVPVSWLDLLGDLERWDHPERLVQREWARAFVALSGRREDEETSED